jgi:hypothetical protein
VIIAVQPGVTQRTRHIIRPSEESECHTIVTTAPDPVSSAQIRVICGLLIFVSSWLGGHPVAIDGPQSLEERQTNEEKSFDPQIYADKTETG